VGMDLIAWHRTGDGVLTSVSTVAGLAENQSGSCQGQKAADYSFSGTERQRHKFEPL